MNFFKTWGYIIHVSDVSHKRPKLCFKNIKSIFLGYAPKSKVYRSWSLKSNTLFEIIDAEFFEHLFIKDASLLDLEKKFAKELDVSNGENQILSKQSFS